MGTRIEISEQIIATMSWVGILEIAFIIRTQYIYSNSIVNLYTIFMILSFLFNYGQCLLWALGVEADREIGAVLYRTIRIDNTDIFRTQLYYVIAMMAIHSGYMCFCKHVGKASNRKHQDSINKTENKFVYEICLRFSWVIFPVTLVAQLLELRQALQYGYGSLYYGEYATSSSMIAILSFMFLPCMIGILIGSNYKKSAQNYVYIVFAMYMVINLLKGDRGSWFYKLLILLWMHHRYCHNISKKNVFKLGIIGIVSLYLIKAIVTVRNTGISFEAVKDALFSIESNPIFSFIAEMGKQFEVDIIAINYNVHYPYGNTYLLSLIAMVSMTIPRLLGIQYLPLSTWFSSSFLSISWGAAFTMIAEAALNYGIYGAPLFLFILGAFSTKFLDIEKATLKQSAFEISIKISFASFFIYSVRNQAHDFFKYCFWGCLPLIVVYVFIIKMKKGNHATNLKVAEH